MRGRVDGAQSSFQSLFVLMAVPLAGMAFFLLWQRINDGITPHQMVREVRVDLRAVPAAASLPAPVSATPQLGTPFEAPLETPLEKVIAKREPPAAAAGTRGRIVLIIDDLGFDHDDIKTLMLGALVEFVHAPSSTAIMLRGGFKRSTFEVGDDRTGPYFGVNFYRRLN